MDNKSVDSSDCMQIQESLSLIYTNLDPKTNFCVIYKVVLSNRTNSFDFKGLID